MKRTITAVLGAGFAVAALNANAVPLLQLYIEGATYDDTTDTWIGDGSDPIRLWTIGNIDGPGGKGTIFDVKLAVAYAAGDTPTISLTSSTTGGFGGYTDPSTPSDPSLIQTSTDGSTPVLGDGSALASHGIYGADTWWQEFSLGDFSLTDSPIADFISDFPLTADCLACGQINVYEISATGTGWLHFDLYDHVEGQNDAKYVFAPFSHDGEGGTTRVSEPQTVGLLGLGLIGLAVFTRRRRQHS